jgi:diguanylate cyclase (GGDEF)-like protein/PAS domain S-box-containing protein
MPTNNSAPLPSAGLSVAGMQAILDGLPDLVCICAPDTNFTYASPSFHGLLGYDPQQLVGSRLLELVHLEDQGKLLAMFDYDSPHPSSIRIRHCDGTWRHLDAQARNQADNPAVGGVLLFGRDVTVHRIQAQAAVMEKKRQLHNLNRVLQLVQRPQPNVTQALKVMAKACAKGLGTHRCAYWEVDKDPATTYCVAMYDDIRQNFIAEDVAPVFATALNGLLRQVLQGEEPMVIADVHREPGAALFFEYFHATGIKAAIFVPVWRGERVAGVFGLAHLNYARQWTKDEAAFAENAAGLVTLVFKAADRARFEAQQLRPAHHDRLTGLPNRQFLFDQAAGLLPEITATSPGLAAFFIDIDGFRNINDTLGHAMGDELLKAAALRLKNVGRKDDILVRLGGDEFMLLARNLTNMRVADDIALHIIETLRNPFVLQGRELQVSASVGIALYPFDGTDIETLIKRAELALYQAKSAGRDRYHMFTPAISEGRGN